MSGFLARGDGDAMRAEDFMTQLDGVTKTGNGHLARCPAHDDRRSSLSVSEGQGGKILLKCFAGCDPEAIVGALGLSMADLFNDNGNPEPRIVRAYNYTGESGKLLFQSIRFEPKDFRQRQPDGKDGWLWNLNGTRRVPYRLYDVAKLKPKVLYIAEGEKDVDRLWSLGLAATCNPGGAGKWSEEYTDLLVKLLGPVKIVILADNDGPGQKHALDVARSFIGKAEAVKVILALPGVSVKGDVTDYLEAHSKEDLIELLKATPALTVEDLERLLEAEHKQERSHGERGLRLTRLGDLLAEPEEAVSWLVEDRLPSGGLSIMAAKPKVGKSTLARWLALAVAQGEEWLGCATHQGPVFYLALEEKRAELRRHFEAMGATADDKILLFIEPSPADGLAQLRTAAEVHKPVLIIVDPLFRFVRVKDGNDYAQVTAALEPLLTLARQTGSHVLLVHHASKGGSGDGDGILGSTAIFGSVDTALLLKRSEKYRTLSSIQRYGEDLEEITLTLDPDTQTVTAGPSRRDADMAEVMRAIREYLAGLGDGERVTEAEVNAKVEGRTTVKTRALRALVEEQKVTRNGTGKRGDPYVYSISTSLLPNIYREGEKEKRKSGVSDDKHKTDSTSRNFDQTEDPEAIPGTSNFTPEPLFEEV